MSSPPWNPAPFGEPPPAPPGWGPPPAAEEPAGTLKTFGVLSMVFAVLNGIGGAITILQAALAGRTAAKSFGTGSSGSPIFDDFMKDATDYSEVATKVAAAEAGLMLMMDVALFVIGYLLLQRREGARKAAIAWSIAALVVLSLRAGVFEIVVWPRANLLLEHMRTATGSLGSGPASGSGGLPGVFGLVGGFAHLAQYLALAFMAIFPVCLIAFMTLTSVKAQVRRRP